MNRLNAAQASASSLPVRQALFVILAILVTLVAVQQYARWTAAQQQDLLLPPQVRLVDTAKLNPASAQWAGHEQLQGIERVQASEPEAKTQRWVF